MIKKLFEMDFVAGKVSIWMIIVFAIYLAFCSCTGKKYFRSFDNKDYRQIWQDANELYYAGKIKESFRYTDSAYASVGRVSPYGLYLKYSNYGLYCYKNNHFDSSLVYADSALYVIEENNLQKTQDIDYLHALISKADVLFNLHNYANANDYYFKAKLFASKYSDKCFLNEFSYSIGMALYRQSKYAESAISFENSFNEAYECDEKIRPIYRMQECLSNAALCFTKLNRYDSALYYDSIVINYIKRNAVAFGEPLKAERALGVVYGNMGTVFINLGKLDSAEVLLKKNIAINERPLCENYDAQQSRMSLAGLYFKKKEWDKMMQTLGDLSQSLDTLRDAEVERDWNGLMYSYNDLNGDHLSAFKYYKRYIALRDSINRSGEEGQMTDVLQVMGQKEQQYQVNLLRKDREVSRIALLVIAGFSILVIVIILLIYTGFRRSKRKNRLINNQKTALEKSNREKDRILSVVAHDLRSPLSGVAYMTDMMLNDETFLPVQESFKIIKNTSMTSLALINELLGFSVDEKMNTSRSKVDITGLVKELVKLLEYKAREKNLKINIELPPQEVYAFVTRDKMIRVINNLLGNALKFSREGGVINLVLTESKSSVKLEVSDTGIGIPENLIPQLFEMFTPSKRPGTAGEKSFGLGLAICKQIVEAHGGKIWVKSEVGKGSSFYVELYKTRVE
jgi:signal transduction histidine kinase